MIAEHSSHEFDVVSNPEFLKEGAAIDDFLKPDRVVVGSQSGRAAKTMDELYAPFVRTGSPIIHMDVPSAELTKYAANAMLATRISFMNEIANICNLIGADVDLIRKGIGTDARIGSKFLFAGIGYGGSCFPKDVKAIVRTAADHGYDFKVLRAVEEVNERQKHLLFDRVREHFDGDLRGKHFALWAWPSSPTPMTCARRRPWPSWTVSWTPGRPSPPSTPRPWTCRATTTSAIASTTASVPWTPWREPMPCCW